MSAVATLTRKTHGPEVPAKRAGTCRYCPEPVRAGEDYIAKVDGVGWMHALCAKAYCETINEHVEDEQDQVLADRLEREARAGHILDCVRELRALEVPDEALGSIVRYARGLVEVEA